MEAHVASSPGRAAGGVPVPVRVLGDERLARQVAGGGQRAFAVLYERYHQRIYRYCRSMVRNDADAQDVTQSTFARALAALQRGQRDAPLRPWLFRIAHNESISLLRRRRPEEELPDALGSAAASLEDAVAERARLAQLVADLHELPDRQRDALLMRELAGLSHDDVAVALGISVGAAKQTVFEARRSLQDFADGREMSCEDIRRTVSDGDGRALRGRRVRAHLRDCPGCRSFAAAIAVRRADFQALYPPISAVAASGMLVRLIGGGSGHVGSGSTGLVSATAAKTAGLAGSLKGVAAGAAVLATVAAGTAGFLAQAVPRHSAADRATTAPRSPAPADRSGVNGGGNAPGAAGTSTSGVANAIRGNAVIGTTTVRSSRGGSAAAARSGSGRLSGPAAAPTAGGAAGSVGARSRSGAPVGGATGTPAGHGRPASPGRPLRPGSRRSSHGNRSASRRATHPRVPPGASGSAHHGAPGGTTQGHPAANGPGASGSAPSGASGPPSSSTGGSASGAGGGSGATGSSATGGGGAAATGAGPSAGDGAGGTSATHGGAADSSSSAGHSGGSHG